jgi:hypothetical protein
MASPSSQKAGHMPCFVPAGFSPKRMAASNWVILPGAGVKEEWDSIRAEVHSPVEGFLRGTSWTVPPPEIWRFWLEEV